MLSAAPIRAYIPASDVPRARKCYDVEAEVADLKARGVKFEEYDMPGLTMKNSIATGGGAKTAWFKDTEGNILAVSQRL
jgi:hypothetical protein